MKKTLNQFIGTLVMMCLLTACEYGEFIPSGEIPQNVSYSNDIIPIFNESCNSASCHATGAIPPDLSPENGYNYLIYGGMVDTTQPEESILYKSMINEKDPMPPTGKLSEYETNLVLGWIQQGAKNN